ncbi:hypothetical protein BDR26DRAFT_286937 [Obelidium mucronatum]|nr:hypothetical protein BDR26DRAFT_286937 [Obelidium mucronatum]
MLLHGYCLFRGDLGRCTRCGCKIQFHKLKFVQPESKLMTSQASPNFISSCSTKPVLITVTQYSTVFTSVTFKTTVVVEETRTTTVTTTVKQTNTTKARKCKPKTVSVAARPTCYAVPKNQTDPTLGLFQGIQTTTSIALSSLSTASIISTSQLPKPSNSRQETAAVTKTSEAPSAPKPEDRPTPPPPPIIPPSPETQLPSNPVQKPPTATNQSGDEGLGITKLLSWHWFNSPTLDCFPNIQPFEYNSGFYAGSENGLALCGSKATFKYAGNTVQVTIAWKTTGGVGYHELSAQAFGALIGSKEVVKTGMAATDWQLLIQDPGRVTGTCFGTC